MRVIQLLAILGILFLIGPTASVFAGGYAPDPPQVVSSGAPALSGSQFSGIFTVQYPDGRPVTLAVTQITLLVCGSKCVLVPATATRTAIGTYAYSFALPSLGGSVTIFIPAGSLTDDHGRPFPTVDKQIGAYSAPTPSPAPPPAPVIKHLPSPSPPHLMNQALSLESGHDESFISQLVLALGSLLLASCGLMILPSKK